MNTENFGIFFIGTWLFSLSFSASIVAVIGLSMLLFNAIAYALKIVRLRKL